MLLIDYCNAMLHVYTKTVFKTEITPMSVLYMVSTNYQARHIMRLLCFCYKLLLRYGTSTFHSLQFLFLFPDIFDSTLKTGCSAKQDTT